MISIILTNISIASENKFFHIMYNEVGCVREFISKSKFYIIQEKVEFFIRNKIHKFIILKF